MNSSDQRQPMKHKGGIMSTELFIHRSLLPVLLWLALCAILAGIILEAVARLKQERPTTPVVWQAAIPPTEIEWVSEAPPHECGGFDRDSSLWGTSYPGACTGAISLTVLRLYSSILFVRLESGSMFDPVSEGRGMQMLSTQAMDKVIAELEQDETLEWKVQYRVVEDAELVAEQYQARLESEREG
jgi:hypothetical protein